MVKIINVLEHINHAFEVSKRMCYKFVDGQQSIWFRHFLKTVALHELNTQQTKYLKLPISMMELHSALKLRQKGKAPGPGGFPGVTFFGKQTGISFSDNNTTK